MSDQTISEAVEQTPAPEPEENLGPAHSVEDLDADTRALFEQYAQANSDEEEAALPAESSAETPTPTAEAAPAEPAAGEPPPETPPEEPTAPKMEPDPMASAFEKLRTRENEVEAKREELKELEAKIRKHEALADEWKSDRLGTLKQFIEEVAGTSDPAAVLEEVKALYDPMTLEVLDVKNEDNESRKARVETARVRRELAEHKAEMATLKKEQEEAAERAAFEQHMSETIDSFDVYVSDAAHEYPFLAKRNDAGKVIWATWQHLNEQDPDAAAGMNLASVAKSANDAIETEIRTLVNDFTPLLAPEEGGQSAEPSEQTPAIPALPAPPPPSNPAPRTLTNSQVSQTSQPPPEPEWIEDHEEAAAATLAHYAKQYKT